MKNNYDYKNLIIFDKISPNLQKEHIKKYKSIFKLTKNKNGKKPCLKQEN